MAYFLILHTRYKDVQIGIYNDYELLHATTLESKVASKLLTTEINTLLHKANITLVNLQFIGAHLGPAPFTTLRVALATANGLAYTTNLPLIGVNGLSAITDLEIPNRAEYVLVMLNAFCNDVYYALYEQATNTILMIGSMQAKELLPKIAEKYAGIFYIIGNGTGLHRLGIEECFGKRAHIDHTIEIASLEQIAQNAYTQFTNCSARETQLLPIYLKNQFGRAEF